MTPGKSRKMNDQNLQIYRTQIRNQKNKTFPYTSASRPIERDKNQLAPTPGSGRESLAEITAVINFSRPQSVTPLLN
jgi:hypothetical protein